MEAVTGISDHIGWAEFVTIGVVDRRPMILDRRRVALIDQGAPSAPYHHEALAMPLAEARLVVDRTRAMVAERCHAVLRESVCDFSIGGVVLQESPLERIPDDLADVLASRHITCAADGMLYREFLATAATQLGLAVRRYPRRSNEITAAATAAGVTHATVTALLKSFGVRVGVPWRKEHQLAAASALAMLASLMPLEV